MVRTDRDERFCDISDMCLVADDRIVVVDRDNYSVKLLEVTTGHVLHQLQLQDEPWGVCRMAGDRVAVTLPLAKTVKVSFFTSITNI